MTVATPLPPLPQLAADYVCPDQRGSVSEAVHQARLAAGDPRCGSCPFNPARTAQQPGLSHEHGHLRGRHLRGLDAFSLAARLTDWVAVARPRSLVVGQDDRFASADLAPALDALARAGVTQFDLGTTTRSVIDFAIDATEADGGVYLTGGTFGAGRGGAGWGGVDLIGPHGNALPLPPSTRSACSRLARHGAASQPIRAEEAYDRSLAAIVLPAPIRLHVEPVAPLLAPRLDAMLAVCGTTPVDPGVRCDLSATLSRDSRTCRVSDENGRPIAAPQLAAAVAPAWATVNGRGSCRLVQADADCRDADLESLLLAAGGECGLMTSGDRILGWTGQRFICDGLMVLALTLRTLATRDEPASRVLHSAAR